MLGSALSMYFLWFTSIPLGIPGEWTWERASIEPDFCWNLCGGLVAAALVIAFVALGYRRFACVAEPHAPTVETALWLSGLVVASFVWLWIVQEVAPVRNRLGKAAFVLYYGNSSGYFTRARYEQPRIDAFLAGYEDLMREGDVLHTGTHPPGLFLAFHGLIHLCESSPLLSRFLDQSQPPSFREATDIIAANNLRRRDFRPLMPLDRRVLWLATLCVMLSAACTVVPLYGLIRRTSSRRTAWLAAAIWPAVPALAIFIPKSDALFPLLGLCHLWLWLKAWESRSLIAAVLAGFVAWLGMLCSLAFLPVFLLSFLLTVVTSGYLGWVKGCSSTVAERPTLPISEQGIHRGWCIVCGVLGFLLPTVLSGILAKINLLSVWWLNYQNHAGFYQQYPRTYWKWLLVNPVELTFSSGWPVAIVTLLLCDYIFRRLRLFSREALLFPTDRAPEVFQKRVAVVCSIVSVVGLLWLSGKNSGEAARLWIMFLPWMIWVASIQLEADASLRTRGTWSDRNIVIFLAFQFLVSLLTVSRVSGFHLEAG